MTDHGNMFGAVEFYREAMSHGIKPIIGIEAYLAPESRLDKRPIRWADGGEDDATQASDACSEGGAAKAKGEAKYGTTMDRNDLTPMEWIQHLQEELMDAVVYLEKVRQTGGV